MKSFVKVPSTFSSLISTIILTSFTSIEGTWQYKTNVDIELASRSSWSVSNQQSACLHWAYTSHILISNNIYQLTINHKPIKESRILRDKLESKTGKHKEFERLCWLYCPHLYLHLSATDRLCLWCCSDPSASRDWLAAPQPLFPSPRGEQFFPAWV